MCFQIHEQQSGSEYRGPHEVPVANARKQATRNIIAGSIFTSPSAEDFTISATNSAAPRLSVILFKVHAKVRIRIAGYHGLKSFWNTCHTIAEGQHSAHHIKKNGDHQTEEASKHQSDRSITLGKAVTKSVPLKILQYRSYRLHNR